MLGADQGGREEPVHNSLTFFSPKVAPTSCIHLHQIQVELLHSGAAADLGHGGLGPGAGGGAGFRRPPSVRKVFRTSLLPSSRRVCLLVGSTSGSAASLRSRSLRSFLQQWLPEKELFRLHKDLRRVTETHPHSAHSASVTTHQLNHVLCAREGWPNQQQPSPPQDQKQPSNC